MPVDKEMRVPVVDDCNTMFRIISNLFKKIGFSNVDAASDGCTALQMLREADYGLVISDWNMELMTGLQLLKEVRADELLKPLPFIMFASESKTENVIAAKQAGLNTFFVKPFNAEILTRKLNAVHGDF